MKLTAAALTVAAIATSAALLSTVDTHRATAESASTTAAHTTTAPDITIALCSVVNPPAYTRTDVCVGTVGIVSRPVVLTPCVTEDSDNCYWNAATRFNGKGRSFVVLNGTYYYGK